MTKVREWVYHEEDGWEHKVDFYVGEESIEAAHQYPHVEACAQKLAETDDRFMAHLRDMADKAARDEYDAARADHTQMRERW